MVNDNTGKIVCVNPIGIKDFKARRNLTVKAFERILNVRKENIEESFSASIHLDLLNKARINEQLLIGEAAGFQDLLAGFGMIYVF